METTIIIVILLSGLILHEFGHALAMKGQGVEIKEIGLGLPLIPALVMRFRSKIIFGYEIDWTISPFLIGAYVKNTEKGNAFMQTLPRKEQAFILGAGIISNLIQAAIMIAFSIVLRDISLGHDSLFYVVLPYSLVVACPLIYWFRYFFSLYLIPLIGLALLIYLIPMVFSSPLETFGGPISIVQESRQVADPFQAYLLACLLIAGLGIINSLPFYGLDGGQIVELYVPRRCQVTRLAFKSIGLCAVFIFIGLALLSDLAKLIF